MINNGNNFMIKLSAPAQRALNSAGIKTIRQLSNYTKSELLKLHGFGPVSIPILENELSKAGLSFKN